MAYTAGQKLRANQMSVYVCTSSTRPPGHSGQLIYETDTGLMLIRTSGGSWNPILGTGEVNYDGEWNQSGPQSIAHATDTIAEFGTTNVSTPLVTKGTSGVGHTFTVQKAGRWIITSTMRWGNTSTAGERYMAIRKGGSPIASQGVLKAGLASPITFNQSVTARLVVGDVISVWLYQTAGVSQSTEVNNGSAWGRLNMSWIGP